MIRILFVCTGNLCRSPSAEYLFRAQLKARGITEVETASSGTRAIPNNPAAPLAEKVGKEIGIDLSPHRTRVFTKDLVEWADKIMIFQLNHRDRVLELDPSANGKIVPLWEFVSKTRIGEIIDPYGKEEALYRVMFDQIQSALHNILEKWFTPNPSLNLN